MKRGVSPAIDKGLPANLDIERMTLGAIMVDSPGALQKLDRLHIDDFSIERHRLILSAQRLIIATGQKIDRMTVMERLRANRQLDAAGGISYVNSLDDGMPRVLQLESWIQILHEKAALRRLAYIGQHAVNRVLAGEGGATEIVMDLGERLAEIGTNGCGHPEIKSAEELIGSWQRNYLTVAAIEWIIPGMVSRGTTAMFSGIAGCGKSTLACALAWRYKSAGGRVLVLDLENEPATIKERFERLGIEVCPDFLYWGRAMEQPPTKPGSQFVRDLILADRRPLLVVVDSLAAFGGAMDVEFNENDAGQITRFFASFQDLAARDRGTFLVIHHNNREDEFRGSSAIPANIDVGYMVKNFDRSGGTKLDVLTVTPSVKTRRLTNRTTFFYDDGKINSNPDPLASAEADQIKFKALLEAHPGISGHQFETLAVEGDLGRNAARDFLETGVRYGEITRTPGARNSGRFYARTNRSI